MPDNQILPFLSALRENNSLQWMAENRDWYRTCMDAFEQLLGALITRIAQRDASVVGQHPKDLIFRLNRDTRFSKDKSPYRPALRAHISADGKAPVPVGYFLYIEPGCIFLGGGLFASQFADATKMVRDYLLEHSGELDDILKEPGFAAHFTLDGEKLKNIPRGYPKDFPQGEYLKHKSWYIEYHLPDESLSDLSGFCENAAEMFLKMKPFNDFLNRALRDFKMPSRP
ncbi:DUF2461 domain-containing protein [Candidatus Soleaferrea massiliensis]|uniref:DUF2461 domain-containing protein n=1 Tax=Candidatus Soleaferrea massiliensis TaxID=1470354 RepID=UPI0005917C72|nr:DUF2461 domain-containing protein [Candidatus Soleaferrea massiliensis]